MPDWRRPVAARGCVALIGREENRRRLEDAGFVALDLGGLEDCAVHRRSDRNRSVAPKAVPAE